MRFVVGACGTKFGKTFGCSVRLIKEAWENQHSLNWWVAPSYDQSLIAMSLVKRLLPPSLYVEYKADRKLVILNPDGSERSQIHFKSGDNPDTLRGYAVNFFVLDEAARMPYDSFVSVLTTVTQTKGHGIIISTPKGRGWFFDVYQRGEKFLSDKKTNKYETLEDDPWREWMAICLPTWENPTVDRESILQAKKNLPEDVFTQEYAAEFISDSAGVFRGIIDCAVGHVEEPVVGEQYVIGVDLARLNDYTVLTVGSRQRKTVVAIERFNQISWQFQYQKIRDLANKYNRALCVVDSTGIGDPIVEALRTGGVIVEPYKIGGSVAKQQLIEKLRVNIEKTRITYPKNKILLNELESYEYDITEGGTIRYSAPEGKHDDCVISLALLNWVIDQEPFIYKFFHKRV